jgi:hypothetical protein
LAGVTTVPCAFDAIADCTMSGRPALSTPVAHVMLANGVAEMSLPVARSIT